MNQFLFRISIKGLSCSLKITMMMRISSHLHLQKDFKNPAHNAQKMKFSTKHFFSKCDQILRKLRMCSHLLKETSMENFIFRAVSLEEYDWCLSEDCWYVLQSFYNFITETDWQDSVWKYNPIPSKIPPPASQDDILRRTLEENNKYNCIQKERQICP